MKYNIFNIEYRFESEQLGTKEKFWIYDDGKKALFKIGRENTRENLAEKVACEIGKLLDLPVANYEFAKFKDKLGILSHSIVAEGERLVHGNELLGKLVKGYPQEKYYKVREYKIDTVLALLKMLENKFNGNFLSNFIGYLIFDCLIANQDRHHENWGLIVKEGKEIVLAPSFDHASSLGCRVTKEEIQKRFTTKDKNYTIDKFCKKAKTPFYNSKQLTTIDVVKHIIRFNKKSVCYWIDKIYNLDDDNIRAIFDKIPKEFQEDEIVYEFMMKIIDANKNRLRELLSEHKI